ncbi:MAG TPA: response regulator [Steroidobacter sp.]|uniref:response regulator transcription factor n=1 Tax=Steroidobacter sp. TaxID=1978227 RepID=UPI002EDB2B87
MSRTPPTVFIVDDDADVRRALARLLSAARYNTRSFGSAVEFLEHHDPSVPGCLLLDLAMPDRSGLEVQSALAEEDCHRPIVFLSGHGSIAESVVAMRAGAINFLTKPVDNEELLAALEEALRLDEEQRRATSLKEIVQERIATLTPREREVLAHVVEGRMNKQIAGDLGTVLKTIKVHRARVMHKMRVRSLAQLVKLISASGVVLERQKRGPEPVAELPFNAALEPKDGRRSLGHGAAHW